MAMDLGDAKLTLRAEDNTKAAFGEIEKSTKNMSANFKKAGLAITAMGVALAVTLGKMVKSYADAGDQIGKMSKATGLSTESLSILKHMADLSGSSLQTVGKGALTLQKNIVQASDGLATYTREFDRLGLSVEDLLKLTPEEQFFVVATALAEMEDVTVRNAAAQALLGRAGKELLPMLDTGAAGIKEMADEAQKFAVIYSKEATEGCEAFNDSITTLKASSASLIGNFATELMPILTDIIGKISEVVVGISGWIKEHEGLAKALAIALGLLTLLTITGGPMLLLIGFFPQIKAGILMVSGLLTKTLIPAVIRAASAFIALLASMGPAGWAAIGLAIGATAVGIAALVNLLKPVEIPEIPESPQWQNVPSAQFGGVIPGPIGKPVPIIAHGGEQFAGVGKSIAPINIHIGNFMGDESSLRAFSRTVKDIIGQDIRRTSFSGINRLEYFPGSSAP